MSILTLRHLSVARTILRSSDVRLSTPPGRGPRTVVVLGRPLTFVDGTGGVSPRPEDSNRYTTNNDIQRWYYPVTPLHPSLSRMGSERDHRLPLRPFHGSEDYWCLGTKRKTGSSERVYRWRSAMILESETTSAIDFTELVEDMTSMSLLLGLPLNVRTLSLVFELLDCLDRSLRRWMGLKGYQ